MRSRPKRQRDGAGAPEARASAFEETPAADVSEHVARLYARIYEVVRRIPCGRVATYGQVAELAGIPRGGRVAGTALRVSTAEMGLPWQRVVGKRSATSGQVSIHDPVGAAIQRELLEGEGVEFSASDAISLKRFGWLPTD